MVRGQLAAGTSFLGRCNNIFRIGVAKILYAIFARTWSVASAENRGRFDFRKSNVLLDLITRSEKSVSLVTRLHDLAYWHYVTESEKDSIMKEI